MVLLLETMLAFHDKEALLQEISHGLPAGGRFAFTLEEGLPLTESERIQMPAADTVWLTRLDEMRSLLERAGLAVRWEADWSESHREVAASLADAYAANSTAIAAQTGGETLHELIAAHRLWSRVARDGPRPQVRCRRRAKGALQVNIRSRTATVETSRHDVQNREPHRNRRHHTRGLGLPLRRRPLAGVGANRDRVQRSRRRPSSARLAAGTAREGDSRYDPLAVARR